MNKEAKEDVMNALLEAEEAFNEYLNDQGCDPAYYEFSAEAEALDIEFEGVLWKVEISEGANHE